MKKKYYSWHDIERMCFNIVTDMFSVNYKPDYIVGITRGGLVPATILSNMTDIPADTLQINFRDNGLGTESNCWMAEEAFGYGVDEENNTGSILERRKKILIVDDINDTGRTFKWLMQDWETNCRPTDPAWKDIWGHTVKFAVLTENEASEFDLVSFYCDTVNKAEEDVWLVYPWENVGIYK